MHPEALKHMSPIFAKILICLELLADTVSMEEAVQQQGELHQYIFRPGLQANGSFKLS